MDPKESSFVTSVLHFHTAVERLSMMSIQASQSSVKICEAMVKPSS